MALTVITEKNKVSYQALSTDISGSKINGANWIGADVYIVDTQQWYRVKEDLTLGLSVNNNVQVIHPIDDNSQALVVIDFAHHEIHEGNHFIFTYVDGDLDAGEIINLMLVTPNSSQEMHMTFHVTGIFQTNVSLYEEVGFTGGSSMAAFNNNRNSSTGSPMQIFLNPSGGSGSGLKIYELIFGSDGASPFSGTPTESGERIEFILRTNTKYLLFISSGTANNRICVKIDWYAHIYGDI